MMVMIRRINSVLLLCALHRAFCEAQYVIGAPPQIVPIVTNSRTCCPYVQAQPKQIYVWYGTKSGGAQQTGYYSNTTRTVHPTFPRVQTGYSTAQNPGATYQQNTGTPGPQPQSSTDPSQNRQNDFTGQFYPVTPSSGGYTSSPGSYNNANAGYQSPTSNYYSTGNSDFNTSPPEFPILNPGGSAYNNENSAGGEYGQPTGDYYNQGSQSGATQNQWSNQGSQSGATQNQWSGSSSTPPNYIAPQVWEGGYYSTSSSGSSTPYPSSGDQNSAGYGPSSQPNYGAGDSASAPNEVVSSWESTPSPPSSQWMQGGSYSDTTSSQNQNQPYEQSTPTSGQYYGGFSSSTNYPGTTAFQYTSTQNPLSLTPPPDAATSAWSYNDGTYSSTPIPYRDESSSSAGQQGMNAPFAASYGDSTPGSTQGSYQGYQEFMSSTEATPSSSAGYQYTSSGSTRYGQNPDGNYVQAPQSSSPPILQYQTTTASYVRMNDDSTTRPYFDSAQDTRASTSQTPGIGPQYDFQHNMNTVYGNYDNWPNPTRQLNDASFTASPELSSSAKSMTLVLFIVAIAMNL